MWCLGVLIKYIFKIWHNNQNVFYKILQNIKMYVQDKVFTQNINIHFIKMRMASHWSNVDIFIKNVILYRAKTFTRNIFVKKVRKANPNNILRQFFGEQKKKENGKLFKVLSYFQFIFISNFGYFIFTFTLNLIRYDVTGDNSWSLKTIWKSFILIWGFGYHNKDKNTSNVS